MEKQPLNGGLGKVLFRKAYNRVNYFAILKDFLSQVSSNSETDNSRTVHNKVKV